MVRGLRHYRKSSVGAQVPRSATTTSTPSPKLPCMASARIYSPVLSTPRIYKAHGEDTSTAVLTYPVFDQEGEWIEPNGGDWSSYPLNPKVDWHHGTPIGRGEVTLKAISIQGKNWVVPVGTTKFFGHDDDLNGIDLRVPDLRTGKPTNKSYSREECLSRAAEVKYLVLNDHATGVSIEIDPLERRPIAERVSKAGRFACAYPRWRGLGWAHVFGGDQVNPGAQTVAKAHATRDLILGGKMPDGTPFSQTIRKAFESVAGKGPVSVTSGWKGKAMDYPEPAEPVADVPVDDPVTPEDESSDTPDEASVPTDVAQLFVEAADRLQAVADKTLHKQSNKWLPKYAEQAQKLAQDLMAHADSIGDELASRKKGGDEDPDKDDEDPDAPEDDDEDDEPKDVEKAWPRVAPRPLKESLSTTGRLVCKAFNYVARLRMADLKPVEKANGSETTDAAEFDRLMQETLSLVPRQNRPNRRSRT